MSRLNPLKVVKNLDKKGVAVGRADHKNFDSLLIVTKSHEQVKTVFFRCNIVVISSVACGSQVRYGKIYVRNFMARVSRIP